MTPGMNADAERYFCHGSGASLAAGGFTEHWKVCDFGYRAWAPSVVFAGQRYVMLFTYLRWAHWSLGARCC
jgi:hypothetical protein